MASNTLNYELLQKLVDEKCNHHLEITKVHVTRFGDDTSEIQLGQTVPFVATARFVCTREAYGKLKDQLQHLAVGDVLFAINDRAEVVTEPNIPIDTGSVARWIRDHFEFTFQVRGLDRPLFRPCQREPIDADQFATFYPWLQEINTATLRSEVIDIDVEIQAKTPESRTGRRHLLSIRDLSVPFEHGVELTLALEVEGNYASVDKLKNGRYWIALHSHDDPDLTLALRVCHVSTTGMKQPSEEPQAVGTPSRDTTKASKS